MQRLILKNIIIDGVQIERLPVFCDDNGGVVVLTLLWSLTLTVTGSNLKWRRIDTNWQAHFRSNINDSAVSQELFETNIESNTIQNYAGHLYHFLCHINQISKLNPRYSLAKLEQIDHSFINNYINVVLPHKVSTYSALTAHAAAIASFFTFLSALGLRGYSPIINILRKTKQLLSSRDTSRKKISYISKSQRSTLLQSCNNQRDRLILRMGFEVGLRTSENQGLVLNSFKARNEWHQGLLDIFKEADDFPEKDRFQFLLNGQFTKGGRSRYIFFSRSLVLDMRTYYQTERNTVLMKCAASSNYLFLRSDFEGIGNPIGPTHGTRLFNKLRKQYFPREIFSYHDLRHTFATELYYAELLDEQNRETRSENAARIVVCQRLGHKDIKTTLIYIQLLEHLRIIEKWRA